MADSGTTADSDPAVSAVIWEDDDGQKYKRVWDDGPKDVPVDDNEVL